MMFKNKEQRDTLNDRKTEIWGWMEALCQRSQAASFLFVEIKDTTNTTVASITLKGIHTTKDSRQTLIDSVYDPEKACYTESVQLFIRETGIEYELKQKLWDVDSILLDIPDTCITQTDFIEIFKRELIGLLFTDMRRNKPGIFKMDSLTNITQKSELDVNTILNLIEFVINFYHVIAPIHNVDSRNLCNQIVIKLRDEFTQNFPYTDEPKFIPTHLVEFLVSLNYLFPCIETLDFKIFVLDDKQLARPFIIKEIDGRYKRVTMFDEDYARHKLAKTLIM